MHQQLLTLYYSPKCPFSKKVLHFLKTYQQPISLKNVENDPSAREELLHLGGKPQTPCLFINGSPLYESDDIITYLKEHLS